MDLRILYDSLIKNSFNFFTGIPDTTLIGLLDYVSKFSEDNHIRATSEAEAVGIASGHYISSGEFPVVYLQNDGFANALNPITSLIDKSVFNIPILFIIGWRGHPEIKDAPQHTRIGSILPQLLDSLEMEYELLDDRNIPSQIERIRNIMIKKTKSFALLIKKGNSQSHSTYMQHTHIGLKREEVIETIVTSVNENTFFIATTGKTARELFEIREKLAQNHHSDLYMVGSMGCAAGIGLGIARNVRNKEIIVLDGDGAVLMRLGIMATLGHYLPSKLTQVIINNFSYESTGGQKSISSTVNFLDMAKACGYPSIKLVETVDELKQTMNSLENIKKPLLLVVNVDPGSRDDLGRPGLSPIENKKQIMEFLQ